MSTAARFTHPDAAYAFILGGHAFVTLKSEKTGQHFTYRVNKAEGKHEQDKDGTWFVALLTAPDTYTYMGMLKQTSLLVPDHLIPTKSTRIGPDAPSWKAFDWTIGKLFHGDVIPPNLDIWHDGRCGRCGRQLTHPDSIETGIGPECRKKFKAEAA